MKKFFKELTNKDFVLSIIFFMLVQFVLFIITKQLESNFHVIMSPIDEKVPFIPHAIYIYNIFGPFTFLVLFYIFCKDKKAYFHGIRAGIIGYIIAHIIFIVYPTIMLRPNVNGYDLDFITSNFIKLTYYIDSPALNCFPSLHCLTCFQLIFITIISKNVKIPSKLFIIFLALVISLSTLFVKQHYFYDIIGALVVFIISNLLAFIIFRKKYIKNLTLGV